MDKAAIFTYKQRLEELTKALKRHATTIRQAELDRIKEILDKLKEK